SPSRPVLELKLCPLWHQSGSLAIKNRFDEFWRICPKYRITPVRLPRVRRSEGCPHVGQPSFVSASCSERSPLGYHRKQSPIRISRRLPGIAVPALAGVAAAFCLAPQALAEPSAAQGTAHRAVAGTASRLDPLSAQLLSAIEQTAQTEQA